MTTNSPRSTGATPEPARASAPSAFEFVKMLATEVSTGTVDLPAFPKVVDQVRRALEDPHNTAEKTARIIGAEPALAARVLAISNSAAFTMTGRQVTELRTAITRLGDNLVRSTAISFAMQQLRQQTALKSIELQLRALWTESIQVAALCHVLARRTPTVIADEAFLTGLLHGIGKLYILVRMAAHQASFANDAALQDIAQEWHAQIAKAVLENWNFPEKMTSAVAEQADVERKHYGQADLADVLLCAIVIARLAGDEAALAEQAHHLHAFRQLSLDMEQCRVVAVAAQDQVSELQKALGEA